MKILCIGNADNLGIRVYLWLKEYAQNVELYRLAIDEDPKRGNPYLYASKDEIDRNPDVLLIKDRPLKILWASLFGSRIINRINKNFDFVIITGGYHALSLSRKIKTPKIFIPIGYEIDYYAGFRGVSKFSDILTNPRHLLRNYIYRWIARDSLSSVDKYLDWFPPTVKISKNLGFESKIVYIAYGEDIHKNRKLINQNKLKKLNKETQNAKRVFLWFSRLNYTDPGLAEYKGANLFFDSLESFMPELKTGNLIVYMGRHGIDAKEFLRMASKSCLYPYIRWVDHLDYPDLLGYLSIGNAVLFTDFGDVNAGISGIGRDGYSVGTPMVNSTTDETMKKQYTVPGPRIYAKEPVEITSTMSALLDMDEEEFENIRRETTLYGEKYIDKSFFLKRLCKEIENLTCNSNLTPPS